MALTSIIDIAGNVTSHLPALKAAGVKTVIRYVGDREDVCIRPKEARAIRDIGGMRLALVFEERGAKLAHAAADVRAVLRWAPQLGVPRRACIYFAVDGVGGHGSSPIDPDVSLIKSEVLPYFTAVRDMIADSRSGYEIGVYGSGLTCRMVMAVGLASRAWRANATRWQESAVYHGAVIEQHKTITIDGLSVDPNTHFPERGDIGDFVPFAQVDPKRTPPPVASKGVLDRFLDWLAVRPFQRR